MFSPEVKINPVAEGGRIAYLLQKYTFLAAVDDPVYLAQSIWEDWTVVRITFRHPKLSQTNYIIFLKELLSQYQVATADLTPGPRSMSSRNYTLGPLHGNLALGDIILANHTNQAKEVNHATQAAEVTQPIRDPSLDDTEIESESSNGKSP